MVDNSAGGETSSIRLAPRWAALVISAMGPLALVIGLAMSLIEEGAGRWLGVAYLVVGAVGVVVAAYGFWPRGLPAVARQDEESVSYAAPMPLVVSLLVGWATLVALSALLAWIVVTRGVDAVESPGAAIVLVLATTGSVPDLVRLLTGRLHRWRVTLAPDGIRYVGYRTAVHVPWDRVRGARLQASRLFRWHEVPVAMRPRQDGPRGYGTIVDLSGNRADLLIPQFLLRVPAQLLAEEIEGACRR